MMIDAMREMVRVEVQGLQLLAHMLDVWEKNDVGFVRWDDCACALECQLELIRMLLDAGVPYLRGEVGRDDSASAGLGI